MSKKGVEIVGGNLDKKDTLLSAFFGATVIFSNTDYFGHLWAGNESQDLLRGRTPNQYAYDREVEQGLNIAEAAALPAVLKTLKHFVYSSLSEARKWSKGKYMAIYHNDSKGETILETQLRFPEIAARMSVIQMGHYVTNWKQAAILKPLKQVDGSYIFKRPLSPDFVVPFVVAEADTGVLVKALLKLPVGTTLEGASEYMSWSRWVQIWANVLGVKATYKQVSMDDFFAGHAMPEVFEKEFREAFAYAEEFGYSGGDPEVMTGEEVSLVPITYRANANAWKLGIKIPTTSMEEYIRNENWTSVL